MEIERNWVFANLIKYFNQIVHAGFWVGNVSLPWIKRERAKKGEPESRRAQRLRTRGEERETFGYFAFALKLLDFDLCKFSFRVCDEAFSLEDESPIRSNFAFPELKRKKEKKKSITIFFLVSIFFLFSQNRVWREYREEVFDL